MIWGLLIGAVLTLVVALLGMALGGGKNYSPLSYIVLLVSLVAFCIEGVSFTTAITAKKNCDNTVALIQEAALSFLPSSAQDYRLGATEAMGVKTGLRFLFPDVADYIEPGDLAGHTVAESTEVLRHSVQRAMSRAIWMAVLWMVITLVVATVLTCVTMGMDGGGGRSHRGNRSGRVAVHGRAPRVSHRGRKR